MQASDYLKLKFQSDRQLAVTGQRGFNAVMQSARGVASDIYSGVERASWYSSCFTSRYQDVCQDLMSEEVRTILSVKSIYKHRDVIFFMLYLYFNYICADVENGNEGGGTQKLIKKFTILQANRFTGKVTRHAMAYGMAQVLAKSGALSSVVVERLSGRVPAVLMGLQVFGMEQKAAQAAKRLLALDPAYYWILYNAELEMLYYFIEPILSEIIKKMRINPAYNVTDLVNEIMDKYNV